MGMLHDFDEDHGGSNGPCDGTGIMSYGSAPNVWSTCSRADFLALYNQIIASSSWNWCLTGKINNFINFFPNTKLELNSKSYSYRGCYCLWRYCPTPRTNHCPTTYHSCTPTTNRLIFFCQHFCFLLLKFFDEMVFKRNVLQIINLLKVS